MVEYDGQHVVYTCADLWRTDYAPQQKFNKLEDAIEWLVEDVDLDEPEVVGVFGPN